MPANTAYAQGQDSLPECDHLTLDLRFYASVLAQPRSFYVVGNRADETLTNVKVTVKPETPTPDHISGSHVYVEDGLRLARRSERFGYGFGHSYLVGRLVEGHLGESYDRGVGIAWVSGSTANKDTLYHWLLPTLPAGTSVDRIVERTYVPGKFNGVRRDTATIEHLASETGEAMCRTERVFWIKGGTSPSDHAYVVELTPKYEIAVLSVDNHFPGAGDTVNFKLAVDARDSFHVNARVEHTPGLELATTTPTITPAPKSPRTLPLAVWRNYDASKRAGDFYIGSEDLDERTETNDGYPDYEITLPLRLKTGFAPDGQCVTATLTGIPEAKGPYVPHVREVHTIHFKHPIEGSRYDDPSDNTARVCLGKPPAAESPVLLTDGTADLLSLHGCAGKTTYPCPSTATTSVELVIAGRDAAANAGAPYQYFQPEEVVVHIPDPAGRNIPKDETSVFWWSGSDDEGDHHSTTHPGFMPGVAIYEFYECRADKDPSAPPDDDPEYKGWKLAIADITDGQGNTIDHTPGAMIIGSMVNVNYRDRTYVDVDGAHGSMLTEDSYDDFKLCQISDILAFEFGALGTYKADITLGSIYQQSGGTDYTTDTGRYTFHVGPVAELSVADLGVAPELAAGEAAYTLDLKNHGPNVAESARVVVRLPSSATGVSTVPSGLGTFLAADADASPARANAHWIWDAGKMDPAGSLRGAGLPQGRTATLIVNGATAGDTATATISNGNGDCEVSSGGSTTTLAYVIREADCDKLASSTWTLTNPYKVCMATTTSALTGTVFYSNVYPTPSGKSDCEANTGNQWREGTVLDHRQSNNTTTLTARSAAGDGLSGASASRPTIELDWQSVSGASEYRVFRSADGTAGSFRQVKIVDKNTTDYTDEAVSPGETYYYRVEALYANRRLADIHATSVTATIRTRDSQSPGQVGDLAAARRSNDENVIDVSWTAPSNAMATTLYNVEYKFRKGSDSWPGDWTRLATEQAGTSYTLSGAGGGTSYQFRVLAVNVIGTSSWRGVSVGPVSAPDQVSNLNAARDTNDETIIVVSWDAPSGGATPDGYEVGYREGSAAWATTTVSTTTYTLNGAKGLSAYRFQVRTLKYSGGDTIYGSWRTANTVPAVPRPNRVNNLNAARDANNETIINVTWTAPNNATGRTRYEAEYKEDGGSWTGLATSSAATSTQLTGASGARSYQFRARAVTTLTTGKRLEGSWRSSSAVQKVPPPNRVSNLNATRDTDDETKITVTWTAPSNATSRTTYDVQYKRDNGAWATSTTDLATTTHQFTNAAGGSRY